MNAANAFVGQTTQPTQIQVAAALDASNPAWEELIRWFAEQRVTEQEWKSVYAKYGWSLRLKFKKRTIIHLGPSNACFLVVFILGDRAVEAARKSSLPKEVIKQIDQAKRYAEGTGVRLIVKGSKDLATVRKLALIKLAN